MTQEQQLESELKDMREALAFYADVENYKWIDFSAKVFEDGGELARSVLKGGRTA